MKTPQGAFLVGQGLREKLRGMVAAYDDRPIGGGPRAIPVRHERLLSPQASGGITVGTFATDGLPWAKGTAKNVHVYRIDVTVLEDGETVFTMVPEYTGDGSPKTELVLNIFSTLPPNYDAVRYCAFTRVGNANLLVASEC